VANRNLLSTSPILLTKSLIMLNTSHILLAISSTTLLANSPIPLAPSSILLGTNSILLATSPAQLAICPILIVNTLILMLPQPHTSLFQEAISQIMLCPQLVIIGTLVMGATLTFWDQVSTNILNIINSIPLTILVNMAPQFTISSHNIFMGSNYKEIVQIDNGQLNLAIKHIFRFLSQSLVWKTKKSHQSRTKLRKVELT